MPRKPAANPVKKERDAERSKRKLLNAAQELFSIRGYAEVGIRDIAARAGINTALVAHYFDSKKGLFAAALDEVLPPDYFSSVQREKFGSELVDALLRVQSGHSRALPMLIYAAGDAEARAIALDLLEKKALIPLRQAFGGNALAEERAARMLAVIAGFFTLRQLLPLDPMVGELSQTMRRWLAETFQAIVDETG